MFCRLTAKSLSLREREAEREREREREREKERDREGEREGGGVLCDASVGMNESPFNLPAAHGAGRPPFLPPLTNGAAAVSTALWELFFVLYMLHIRI
jgi:hypothetical protein